MTTGLGETFDPIEGPSLAPYLIVPSDTDPLPAVPKGIKVGGQGGVVRLRGARSDEDIDYPCEAGEIIPVGASHVRLTGTTATGLIALA